MACSNNHKHLCVICCFETSANGKITWDQNKSAIISNESENCIIVYTQYMILYMRCYYVTVLLLEAKASKSCLRSIV